ncbi:MAG: hypothetical protein M1308_09145 [Actinobacteria bacterium]|nr:hypothetical protein [Actinomycetota bacterium]
MPKSKALTTQQKNKVETMLKALNPTAIATQDLLPPELMSMLEDKMPAWLKDYVADGTSVLRWNWEFLIILEQILRADFAFDEKEIIKVEKRLKEIFPRIEKFKGETPRLLQPKDFSPALRMVRRDKKLFIEQQGWQKQLGEGTKKELKAEKK